MGDPPPATAGRHLFSLLMIYLAVEAMIQALFALSAEGEEGLGALRAEWRSYPDGLPRISLPRT
jgi:hypothetical protein